MSTFLAATLGNLFYKSPPEQHAERAQEQPKEDMPLLSTAQIVTGSVELLAVIGLLAGGICLLSNVHGHHHLGLTITNTMVPYLMMGGAGYLFVIDFITLAVQTAKKFNALKESIQYTETVYDGPFLVIEGDESEGSDEVSSPPEEQYSDKLGQLTPDSDDFNKAHW